METRHSSEIWVLTRCAQRHIPADGIRQSPVTVTVLALVKEGIPRLLSQVDQRLAVVSPLADTALA
jgi:hypothetical protein